jgi:hypothetical protein
MEYYDPIIDEVRAVRRTLQEESGNNLRNLFEKLKDWENLTDRDKVSLDPKRPAAKTDKAA